MATASMLNAECQMLKMPNEPRALDACRMTAFVIFGIQQSAFGIDWRSAP
jgi:hypothetical protein